ncbi:ankyrin repeat-containing domain protein [Aspergillus tetrazonus]
MEVTNVHMTAYFGLAYTMERLCESLQELNMDPEDTHGRTPLCWAAEKGFVEVVNFLLRVGKVDINFQDRHGRSPLSDQYQRRARSNAIGSRSQNGHDIAVGVLLKNTAIAPDAGDVYSQTPLSWAAGNGHETVVRQLLQSPAVDINSQSMLWRTPLSWAAQNGHEAVVKVLLAHPNVDPALADSYSRTPLYHAAEHGRVSVVELLETGAIDANCKTIWNTTPMWAAQSGGHGRVVELLVKKGKVKPQLDANPTSPVFENPPSKPKGFHPTERQTLRPDDRWLVIDQGMGLKMEMNHHQQPSWRLLIRSSGWAAGVSYTNVNGAVFIVVLGIHNSSVWYSIATAVEHETLEDVINSYYPSVRPKVLRTDSGTDQFTNSVAEGTVATLCISKNPDIEWGYLMDIDIKSVRRA